VGQSNIKQSQTDPRIEATENAEKWVIPIISLTINQQAIW
jgi:hypothetical protein